MNRLQRLWLELNASLWFVPTLMVSAAIVLASSLILVDVRLGDEWVDDYPMLFGAGADGARGVLVAISGSMVTVAGLIFSLTLATLAQVSTQYTPRVLRNFMSDRANQLVLGSFVSIFVYCLIVLRTIRGGDEGRFIPSLAVTLGLVLALLSIGVLIFFIHHISGSIQAANIVSNVVRETEEAMQRLFPHELGEEAEAPESKKLRKHEAELEWQTVPAPRSGYIRSVSDEVLLNYARQYGCVVRMERGIGDFVAKNAALLSVAGYRELHLLPSDARQRLHTAYSIGNQRTIDQDAGFGFRQIVDIALKALSPGINDPTTAIICVDHLGALLAQLTKLDIGESLRTDHSATERVRVIAKRPSFEHYVGTAFDQIRNSAGGYTSVLLRLLSALATVAECTRSESRRQVLRQHLLLIEATAGQTVTEEYERAQVRRRATEVQQLLVVRHLPEVNHSVRTD